MSTTRFFGIIFFSASLLSTALFPVRIQAQFSSAAGINVSGELRSHGAAPSNDFLVEIYDIRSNTLLQRVPVNHGQFEFEHVPVGSYSVRLVTGPGEAPLLEVFHEFEPGGAPLVLDLPERPSDKPISGFVALRDLQHPIPKKALHDAYQAQQFAQDHDLPKAIAKLEDAIRICPEYRDAHINLGVQFAHLGRIADAHAEFEKALDIGPPAAAIYGNLALTSLGLRQPQEASTFAHKALELDPENSVAQLVLKNLPTH